MIYIKVSTSITLWQIRRSTLKVGTSFFGIDLSHSDEDMQKLFESIDLSGKLIILEDLERSGIDILEVLGYVNNLVEQDGVKVLLVANEEENSARMILPIFPQYHTSLFPDSILNNEVDLIANVSHRYALQKVYVSWALEQNIYPGDVIVFYRTGKTQPKSTVRLLQQ